MTRLRALLRLTGGVLHAVHGVAIVVFLFPRMAPSSRHQRVQWWSQAMLRRLGIGLRLRGSFAPGPKLIVANHVSWVDILAVHAVCPEARFVSKADVRGWPLVGRLVAAGGTLYIERESRRDALRVVQQMAAALRAGDTVAAFPEGTTGDGATLLPFHANVLQAAVLASAPVQPVALRYADACHAISPAAQWLGSTTLAGSVWKLARADGLVIDLQVLPALASHAGGGTDRRTLATHLRNHIQDALS